MVINGSTVCIVVKATQGAEQNDQMTSVFINLNLTRVVVVGGMEHILTSKQLFDFAARDGDRRVESVVDVTTSKGRDVTFRFAGVVDASSFLGQLQTDSEWQKYQGRCVADPCSGRSAPVDT